MDIATEMYKINNSVRNSERGKKYSLRSAIYLARTAIVDKSSEKMNRVILNNGYTFLVDATLDIDELQDEIIAYTIEQFYNK